MNKVYKGTRSDVPLCPSCKFSRIRKGSSIGQEVTYCSFMESVRVSWPIVECNDYHERNTQSLHDMTMMATFITVDKKTGKIGFVAADKATDELKESVYGSPLI